MKRVYRGSSSVAWVACGARFFTAMTLGRPWRCGCWGFLWGRKRVVVVIGGAGEVLVS